MNKRGSVTWTWTNWTFGPWLRRYRRMYYFGVDIGPLEIVWERPTRLHRESMTAFEKKRSGHR